MSNESTRQDARAAVQALQALKFPGLALDAWGPALACSAEWNSKLHDGFAALSSEWQEFLSRRLKEDLSFLQSMGRSQSPEQVWNAYLKYWQKAGEDYTQEFMSMTKLGGELMSSSMVAMRKGIETTNESRALPKAA